MSQFAITSWEKTLFGRELFVIYNPKDLFSYKCPCLDIKDIKASKLIPRGAAGVAIY